MPPDRPKILKYLIILGVFLFSTTLQADTFKTQQLRFPRISSAYLRKEAKIKEMFRKNNIPYPPKQIFIRAFKWDRKLEIWVAKENGFVHLHTFDFCRLSGTVGPKRHQGDFQTPEGFYTIDRFNPSSIAHVSLGINYPNSSDRILGRNARLGGDIFIHGGCGSRGCIPMTDDRMEDIYLIAMEAKNQGQNRIPIHIFPTKLDKRGMSLLKKTFKPDEELLEFWENLQVGYQYFEKNNNFLPTEIGSNGEYLYTHPG